MIQKYSLRILKKNVCKYTDRISYDFFANKNSPEYISLLRYQNLREETDGKGSCSWDSWDTSTFALQKSPQVSTSPLLDKHRPPCIRGRTHRAASLSMGPLNGAKAGIGMIAGAAEFQHLDDTTGSRHQISTNFSIAE